MKRRFILWMFAACFPLMGFAKEPINLAIAKAALIHYHHSGEYEQDINQVIHEAFRYLKTALDNPQNAGKKLAIVLDIDETALSNYQLMTELNFGGTKPQIQALENRANAPAIAPTLRLYRFAKAHRLAVFFISGRPEKQRPITTINLKKAGYHRWDALILKPEKGLGSQQTAQFKAAMRKKWMAKGYTILANIGDQKSDLIGGYANKTFKLPNPFYIV